MANETTKHVVKFHEVPRKYIDRHLLDMLDDENGSMEWYTEGDYYAVWQRTETYDFVHERFGDGSPCGGQHCERAIYFDKAHGGEIVCLADRFHIARSLSDDDLVERKIGELLKQEAIDAGFPEKHPQKGMTWRDLLEELQKQPSYVLDMKALVWVAPKEDGSKSWVVNGDNFIRIADVDPFDRTVPVSENNELSITLCG